MSNISKIKVSGEVYDLKDSSARDNSYAKVAYEWDGDTYGLETVSLLPGKIDFYKVAEAIELEADEYLIGQADALIGAILQNDSDSNFEMMLMSSIFSTFGTLNIMFDGVSYKNNYAKVYNDLLAQATEAGLDFSAILENGEAFGLSYLGIMSATPIGIVGGLMPHFINTSKSITLPADLMSNLYGIDEAVTFSPGLWLLKADLGEEMGFKTLPIHTNLIYIPAKDATIIMNHNFDKMTNMMSQTTTYSISTSYSDGINTVTITNKNNFENSNSNPNDYSSFAHNQKVYICIDLSSTSYEITEVKAEGQETGQIYEVSELISINDLEKYCTFYMPKEAVQITITSATVAATTD